MLHAGELGGLSGRSSEDQARKRLQNQILGRVGEHRNKDKDGEDFCLWVLPDLRQGGAKRAFFWRGVGCIWFDHLIRRLNSADRNQRHNNGQ